MAPKPVSRTSTAHKSQGKLFTEIAAPPPVKTLAQALAPKNTSGTAPHVLVEALAGTGKTTTLVEGLKIVKGLPTKIKPSPQQAAVWDALAASRSAVNVAFVAFNKAIADELRDRVPQGCDAMTMHSFGNKAVRRAYPNVQMNEYRVSDIICRIMDTTPKDLRRMNPILLQATEKLVSLCKMNLVGSVSTLTGDKKAFDWNEELGALAAHYDIECNGSREKVFDLVPQVLEKCLDVANDGSMDFSDMIWLPIVMDLPIFQYDLLLVDESQDLNRCQQALAKKAGKRLVLCGDKHQAIYGFAGADDQSMDRMAEELAATDRGCIRLPLTVTRRCGKAIVKEAQKIVPQFEAHEGNPAGKISTALYTYDDNHKKRPVEKTYVPLVQDGDMVICRVNAPLVSQCFQFLRMGRKANILGRDIGQGLITTVKKQRAHSVPELLGSLDNWLHLETEKEQAKRNPSESRLIALQDRYDCLVCFTEGANTVEEVIGKIETIFTDEHNGIGVRFASIHKSKGLEARAVFLLEPKGATVPHPMAKGKWQIKQEWNLRYVAQTRAIEELIYVGGGSEAPPVGTKMTKGAFLDQLQGMKPLGGETLLGDDE